MTSFFRHKALFLKAIDSAFSTRSIAILALLTNSLTATVFAEPIDRHNAVVELLEGTMTASVRPQDDAPMIEVRMTVRDAQGIESISNHGVDYL